jgi:hypothetical protein
MIEFAAAILGVGSLACMAYVCWSLTKRVTQTEAQAINGVAESFFAAYQHGRADEAQRRTNADTAMRQVFERMYSEKTGKPLPPHVQEDDPNQEVVV